MSWLFDNGNQLIGVLLILAGAVGYLTLYYRRTLKGGGGCGAGCGPRPTSSTHRPEARNPETHDPQAPAELAGRPFVPLENLADRAARVRQNRESAQPKPDDPPSNS